ncbi:hypothetical protein [Thioalkalivibrio nitratireducens]|uniref:hypothetical protein n=1 Tax=Thioalkalivibrio nitratireducens TaxID=186931 RepID=UPI0006939736|nr:hypothetical protein [Thioalkalivibrio nitratireducens]
MYEPIVGAYWPPERRYVEEQCWTLPFTLNELAAPEFVMKADWTLAQLIGYLGTWSDIQRYRQDCGADPSVLITDELTSAWGDAASCAMAAVSAGLTVRESD